MAKNLIPSCCKVLTSQRASAVAWSRATTSGAPALTNTNLVAKKYASFVVNNNSDAAAVAGTRNVKRQQVNYSQAAEAANFRQQSTDSQRPQK